MMHVRKKQFCIAATLCCRGTNTPCSGPGRCRKSSACQTTLIDAEELDPFKRYEELNMPRQGSTTLLCMFRCVTLQVRAVRVVCSISLLYYPYILMLYSILLLVLRDVCLCMFRVWVSGWYSWFQIWGPWVQTLAVPLFTKISSKLLPLNCWPNGLSYIFYMRLVDWVGRMVLKTGNSYSLCICVFRAVFFIFLQSVYAFSCLHITLYVRSIHSGICQDLYILILFVHVVMCIQSYPLCTVLKMNYIWDCLLSYHTINSEEHWEFNAL